MEFYKEKRRRVFGISLEVITERLQRSIGFWAREKTS